MNKTLFLCLLQATLKFYRDASGYTAVNGSKPWMWGLVPHNYPLRRKF